MCFGLTRHLLVQLRRELVVAIAVCRYCRVIELVFIGALRRSRCRNLIRRDSDFLSRITRDHIAERIEAGGLSRLTSGTRIFSLRVTVSVPLSSLYDDWYSAYSRFIEIGSGTVSLNLSGTVIFAETSIAPVPPNCAGSVSSASNSGSRMSGSGTAKCDFLLLKSRKFGVRQHEREFERLRRIVNVAHLDVLNFSRHSIEISDR